MAKSKRKFLATTLLGLAITLSGCSGSGGDASAPGDSGETGDPSLEPVTLEVVIPGAKGANYDEVLTEVNKRLKAEINTQVKFTFVDFADLNQKTNVMLASGENVDLMFDAPWLHLDTMASQGYYEELSELLEQYGPNVKRRGRNKCGTPTKLTATSTAFPWEAPILNREQSSSERT